MIYVSVRARLQARRRQRRQRPDRRAARYSSLKQTPRSKSARRTSSSTIRCGSTPTPSTISTTICSTSKRIRFRSMRASPTFRSVHVYGAEGELSYLAMQNRLNINANLALENGNVGAGFKTIDSTVANAIENSPSFTSPCAFGGAFYNPACWAAVIAAAQEHRRQRAAGDAAHVRLFECLVYVRYSERHADAARRADLSRL